MMLATKFEDRPLYPRNWILGHVSTFEGVQQHVDDHLFMAYALCVLSACMLEDGYTGYLMMSATRHFEKNEPCCTNLTHKNAVINSLVTVCFILTQVGRSQHLPRSAQAGERPRHSGVTRHIICRFDGTVKITEE